MKSFSRVRLFATPWTIAHQAPQSMEFSRQDSWSGLPFPSPADLPNPGTEPGSPNLKADSLPSEPPGKPTLHFQRWMDTLLDRWVDLFFLSPVFSTLLEKMLMYKSGSENFLSLTCRYKSFTTKICSYYFLRRPWKFIKALSVIYSLVWLFIRAPKLRI